MKTESEIRKVMLKACYSMEGGLTYSEIKDLPFDEVASVLESVSEINSEINAEIENSRNKAKGNFRR